MHAVASQQLITESVWLRRLVITALSESGGSVSEKDATLKTTTSVLPQGARAARLYVRLRPEDHLLLRERAAARGMAGATYLSVLARAHLRSLAPLPKDELVALKRSVADLGAIGRNLNQIARAASQGGRVAGPAPDDLRAILKVCGAMRDHVKSLIKANVDSWEMGHAAAPR